VTTIVEIIIAVALVLGALSVFVVAAGSLERYGRPFGRRRRGGGDDS
jgi:hypothetical protein